MVIRALVAGAAVLAAILPLSPVAVERWYSTGLYLRVQRVLTPLSNLLPVAWLDVLGVAAAGWLCWHWWRTLRPGGPRMRRLLGGAWTTVVAAAAVYLAFVALWGLNYRRVPLADRLEMEPKAPGTADVVALGREVVARLNGAYGSAHAAGFHEEPWRNSSLRAAFTDVQRDLAPGAPAAVPGRLKQTLFGPFFRWTAVDGMVNPFGLEVLANPDLLPFEVPFVAAHEWAHLAGHADEAEANFVGWLATIRADQASQYSGWLYLYWQVSGELGADDRQIVARDLREGPRADVAAIVARLRRSDIPALRRATWMVYDSYLKANRVEEGVRSYGAVVTLVLRARFESGWRPIRAPRP